MNRLFRVLCSSLALLAAACGGEAPVPDAGAPDAGLPLSGADAGETPDDPDGGHTPERIQYVRDLQPIWEEHCIRCHFPGSVERDFVTPASPDAFLGRTLDCWDRDAKEVVFVPLVVPGAPEQSALWIKLQTDLSAEPNPPIQCNREMPASGTGLKWLDPEAFEKVERWIREGAKE